MAAKLVLEPVFEADFKDQAYGYRPNKSARDAVEEVHDNLKEGYRHVVDADVAGYFDNIPHDQLLKAVANRVSDGSVLALIKAWLKVPVIEEDDEGNRTYSEGKSSTKGTPQGGVISPLLANIYINRFLKAWEGYGKGEYYDAVLVNYADDFVILSRNQTGAEKALEWTEWAMGQMGLTLNEDKTHLLFADEEDFDFLGYTFGRDYYRKTGRWYLAAKPSAKSVKSLKERIKRILGPSNKANWDFVKGELNQLLSGWANYYSYGSRLLTYRSIDQYVYDAISRFIRRRKKISSRATRILQREVVFGDLGVQRLCHKPRG
jgi:RNA-directed DNA polymerase